MPSHQANLGQIWVRGCSDLGGQKKQGEDMAELPSGLLRDWLQRQLPEAAFDWLAGQLEALRQDPGDRKLHVALGMIPRRLGKDDLALTEADLAAAEAARPGWDPPDWSVDEAARILALLAVADASTGFAARFTELCGSAEVGEAIALYRGLPLYPDPEALEDQAAEGLRTNMRAVFEAVAHRNPFPRERFGEDRWNQMVLKALFIGSAAARPGAGAGRRGRDRAPGRRPGAGREPGRRGRRATGWRRRARGGDRKRRPDLGAPGTNIGTKLEEVRP